MKPLRIEKQYGLCQGLESVYISLNVCWSACEAVKGKEIIFETRFLESVCARAEGIYSVERTRLEVLKCKYPNVELKPFNLTVNYEEWLHWAYVDFDLKADVEGLLNDVHLCLIALKNKPFEGRRVVLNALSELVSQADVLIELVAGVKQ